MLLVDDEPLVRAGVAMLLDAETDLAVVGEAGDGAGAAELVVQLRPDVVVMDLRMPGMDTVEATRQLVTGALVGNPRYTVAVLILTTSADHAAVYAVLRAGASGFILKGADRAELAAAVRAVARGDGWLDPAVVRKLLDDFVGCPCPSLPTSEEMQRLTPREVEVLTLIAHGLTNSAIAEHLVVSDATVRTHVGRILGKLGVHDRAQAVAAAYQSGLVARGQRLAPCAARAAAAQVTQRATR